jgi:Cu/Ag efflux pump CusA
VLAAGALIALPFLGGRFLPEFHENSLIARINALPGTSLEESIRLASRVDLQLRPEVASHVGSRAGRAELDEDAAPVHYIEAVVVLASSKGSWAKLSEEVSKRIGQVPGITYAVEGFLGERVHEILAGEISPIVVKVLGPEFSTLRSIAREVRNVMAGAPGLTAIRSEPQIDVPQIRVKPDRSALARYGIQPLELGEALVLWRQGQAETQLFGRDGRVVDVAVAGSPPWRERSALADLPVDTEGGMISLGALAAIDEVPAPTVVNHDNGERRISVGANARGASLSRVVGALERKLATLELPKGYRIEVGGEVVARTEAATRLLLLGGLILLGVFVILASAFASLADAGIVLLNFPLGLIGGIAAAALSPEGLSVAGFVGFVTLFGIIARNGIMLVAHMRHLEIERPQADPVERVLIAAEERLLPILMTAATAGLGLMPLAFSLGASGTELESPMALIVCGGLITSTALNMLVLPTIYVWRVRRAHTAAIA